MPDSGRARQALMVIKRILRRGNTKLLNVDFTIDESTCALWHCGSCRLQIGDCQIRTTLWCLLGENHLIKRRLWVCTCQILSNAFDKSKKTSMSNASVWWRISVESTKNTKCYWNYLSYARIMKPDRSFAAFIDLSDTPEQNSIFTARTSESKLKKKILLELQHRFPAEIKRKRIPWRVYPKPQRSNLYS